MCQINMGAESSCTSCMNTKSFNFLFQYKYLCFINTGPEKILLWPITMLSKNNCNISIEGRADHPKCSIITGIGGPRTLWGLRLPYVFY